MEEIVVRRVKSMGRRPLSPEGPITVGRSSECDVVLSHTRVSRRHCALELGDDGACRVRDEGSTYGTLVNDERIDGVSAPLRAGDVIGIGPFELVYVTGVPTAPDDLAAELEVRDTRIEVLTSELAKIEGERDHALRERDATRDEVAGARAALDQLRETHDRDRDEHAAQLEAALAELRSAHEREVHALADAHARALAERDARLEEATTRADAAREDARSAHAREVETLRRDHEQALAARTEAHETAQRDFQEENAALHAALEAAPPAEAAGVVEPARAVCDAVRHLSNVQVTLDDREARYAEVEEILASAGDEPPEDLVTQRDELAREFETVHADRDAAIAAASGLLAPLTEALEAVDGAAPLEPARPRKKWFRR